MCGIAGAVWTSPHIALESHVLDCMTDVLAHRGPDGRGTHCEPIGNSGGVALGHRRLSIIDLATGKQPLSNADGTVWITFNGEIYNYRELRADLVARGHRFQTNSDTETIVHLYEEKGIGCLDHLRGMFAFALWDGRKQQLLLARDRLGQKPLVYREEPGRLLFASELKALLQCPSVPREVDPIALDQYLTYSYVPHPRTMFTGIYKLPPAHYAIYDAAGTLKIERYWCPNLDDMATQSLPEMQEQLEHELSEAVRLRLRSDVPLGAFLSGGIDSTAIVGLMQRHSDRRTKTYTIGFSATDFDETRFAQIASEYLQTDHRQAQVRPESVNLLPILTWHFDEPFADSSAIPTYYLAEMTRQYVTVALTGDGGDELFAGYPRYQTIERLGIFDRLPRWLRQAIANPLWQLLPGHAQASLLSKLRFRMDILRQCPHRRYVNWITQFHDRRRQELYTAELATQVYADPADFVSEAASFSTARSPGKQAMHTDLLTYLPCDLLTKVDITSMAHGLECRSPFLDHHVVQLAAAIPYHYLIRGKGTKPFLSQTFAELIPPVLRSRPKMGFRIPLDHWFRHDLRDFVGQLLLSPQSLNRGYFRPTAIRSLIDAHQSGRWNHGDRIWTLLCLEMWHRTYIDADLAPSAPLAQI